MSELVDRVARALCEADNYPPDDCHADGTPQWHGWKPEARAAIAAHEAALKDAGLVIVPREPTEAMQEAAEHTYVYLEDSDFVEMWRAAIDEALRG